MEGVADGVPWQHILPGCKSVRVFGSGGPALWDAFLADIRAHPERLHREENPLDQFVARALHPFHGPGLRWVRCAADAEVLVDFRRLAHEAGLGHRSRLELLLHPEWGTWMGLRAACFSLEAIPPTGPLPGPGPCAGCEAPCVSACPASAITPSGWHYPACSDHRAGDRGCDTGCLSRRACPVGVEHAYDVLERRYHAHRPSGRQALEAWLQNS